MKRFNVPQAIEFCKNSNVNMLVTDSNFLEKEAVFKLYSVSEDLIMHYVVEGVDNSDNRIIAPEELQKRQDDLVYLDTSKIHLISDKFVEV